LHPLSLSRSVIIVFLVVSFFVSPLAYTSNLQSFPTRRSSDLCSFGDAHFTEVNFTDTDLTSADFSRSNLVECNFSGSLLNGTDLDRKSTRLNSSHVSISYAVFCLKKKMINITTISKGY